MKNTAARGSEAERFVHRDLTLKGCIVGSLRHTKGSGDHVAVWVESGGGWLVETKAIGPKRTPFSAFTRPEREAMKATPVPPGWKRMLAVVRGRRERMTVEYISESAWP